MKNKDEQAFRQPPRATPEDSRHSRTGRIKRNDWSTYTPQHIQLWEEFADWHKLSLFGLSAKECRAISTQLYTLRLRLEKAAHVDHEPYAQELYEHIQHAYLQRNEQPDGTWTLIGSISALSRHMGGVPAPRAVPKKEDKP
jgi:hypothetical protein